MVIIISVYLTGICCYMGFYCLSVHLEVLFSFREKEGGAHPEGLGRGVRASFVPL